MKKLQVEVYLSKYYLLLHATHQADALRVAGLLRSIKHDGQIVHVLLFSDADVYFYIAICQGVDLEAKLQSLPLMDVLH